MKFALSRNGLSPFDAEAREFIDSQIAGQPNATRFIEMEPLYDQDMVEFRHIMACIGRIAKALHTTQEQVRAELLFATGNFQLLGDVLGTPVIAVKSMSRHAMNGRELHVFWENAKEVVRTKMLARVTDTAERQRLAESLSLQPA